MNKSNWLNVARRLQSCARTEQQGYAVVSMSVICEEGKPLLWSDPRVTRIEPLAGTREFFAPLQRAAWHRPTDASTKLQDLKPQWLNVLADVQEVVKRCPAKRVGFCLAVLCNVDGIPFTCAVGSPQAVADSSDMREQLLELANFFGQC